MHCRDCPNGSIIYDDPFISTIDHTFLCQDHAREEVEGLLLALPCYDLALMRRRMEDHLRKNEQDLIKGLAELIICKRIKYDDVI
jgi:hypothetical protein